MFTIVVPAFNEAGTIAEVVRAVRGVPGSELIVVDDGSQDETAGKAAAAGARVIRLETNVGKGQAVDAGVRAAAGDTLVFLDADLLGMDSEKVLALVRPVLEGAVMCVGVRHRLFHFLDRRVRWLPVVAKLSGQRCVTRNVWNRARAHAAGYGLESALNYSASRSGRIEYIYLHGLSHTIKEKKWGLRRGLLRRLAMARQVVVSSLTVRMAGAAPDSPGSERIARD